MSAEPLAATHLIDDVEIGTWEWLGSSSRPGPPVVLCHATGFHGRCWDEIIARLGGRHAIALDFRGHGRSGKPDPPYHWRRFGEDLAKLTEHLQIQGAVAVGHSMGGHSAVLAAAINPRAFSSLLLLDPVILPEGAYTGVREPLDLVLPGDALACPPEVEASIYAHSGEPDANIYAEIAEVDTAVHVVRSRESYAYGRFDGSPTAPDLAARFRHGGDEQWLDVSHFIPMEAPGKVAELILRLS
jgi:lipase